MDLAMSGGGRLPRAIRFTDGISQWLGAWGGRIRHRPSLPETSGECPWRCRSRSLAAGIGEDDLSDGVAGGPHVASKRFVDDDGEGSADGIGWREGAALGDLDSHGFKVAVGNHRAHSLPGYSPRGTTCLSRRCPNCGIPLPTGSVSVRATFVTPARRPARCGTFGEEVVRQRRVFLITGSGAHRDGVLGQEAEIDIEQAQEASPVSNPPTEPNSMQAKVISETARSAAQARTSAPGLPRFRGSSASRRARPRRRARQVSGRRRVL